MSVQQHEMRELLQHLLGAQTSGAPRYEQDQGTSYTSGFNAANRTPSRVRQPYAIYCFGLGDCSLSVHGVLAMPRVMLCCMLCNTLWSLRYSHSFVELHHAVCCPMAVAATTCDTSLAIILCDVILPFATFAQFLYMCCTYVMCIVQCASICLAIMHF